VAFFGVPGVMSGNPISEANISFESAPSADLERDEVFTDRPVSFGRRLKRIFWHFIARQFTLLCVIAVTIAGWFGRRRRELLAGQGCEIMLTGRFDSDNWILAHLVPLSASKECSRVWMVSTNPVPEIPKVVAIYPPQWLIKIMGVTPARLVTFLWAAMHKRPHVVSGFHLIPNGIAAAITGRFAGARTLYFCVGGTEVDNEGIQDETNCFIKTNTANTTLRNRRLKIISSFDSIITMGTRAAEFFRNNGINTDINVVSGGIDTKRFYPNGEVASSDIILIARLSPEKRIDIFLQAIKLVVDKMPKTKVIIIGDGKLRDSLEKLSFELGINRNVNFAGYRDDVGYWLRRARIFALTSDLEGLPLSVMEAMMCGLPAVVSDVGDLADLIDDGVNGYLVPRRSPKLFAKHLIELLSNQQQLRAFSQSAYLSALRYEAKATAERWNKIIAGFRIPTASR
jgi:glycosyltransferase involved in cell wall biosynthesis